MSMLFDKKERAEHINGVTYNMSPSADYRHSDVNGNIYQILVNKIGDSLCRVYIENMDLYADEESAKENKEHVIPDIMIICDRKKNYKRRYYGVPKFALETLSPSTAKTDRTLKMDWYAKKGIEEYWIIDYRAKSLEIYYLTNGMYKNENTLILVEDEDDESYNADTVITLKMFPNIEMKLLDIFKNIEDD